MVKEKVTLVNSQGFHMRPAGVFSGEMGKFESDITIKYNGNDINGKSLMNIIAAGIKCGSEIEICCEGADEQQALNKAVELINSGLGE